MKCLSGLAGLFVINLITTLEVCEKKIFSHKTDVKGTYDVIYLAGMTDVDSCRRVCRIYPDCYSFNMQWEDSSQTTGQCYILYGVSRNQTENSTGWTFYCKYISSFPLIICLIMCLLSIANIWNRFENLHKSKMLCLIPDNYKFLTNNFVSWCYL